jgi:hypothetical protein
MPARPATVHGHLPGLDPSAEVAPDLTTPDLMTPDLMGVIEDGDSLAIGEENPPPLTAVLWPSLVNWFTVSLAATCASSATAIVAYQDLVAIEPELPCDRLADSSDLSDRTRLSCAQQQANQGGLPNLVAALQIVADWPTSHPLFSEMEPLLDQWARTVLRSARAKADHQHLDWAMALAMEIPATSATYGEAQQLLHGWQQIRYGEVEAVYRQAQDALQKQQWATALQALDTMEGMEGRAWQTGLVPQLAQEIEAEQRASELWSQARQKAALEGSGFLIEAIALASDMDRSTYLWSQAQPQVNGWSQHLLDQSLAAWYAGDLNRAIILAQGVRPYGERATPATHLVWLSQARQLALASLHSTDISPAARAIGFAQALLIAQQIPADSPVYAQAIASIPTWRTEWHRLRTVPVPPLLSSQIEGSDSGGVNAAGGDSNSPAPGPVLTPAPPIAPPVSSQQPQFSSP